MSAGMREQSATGSLSAMPIYETFPAVQVMGGTAKPIDDIVCTEDTFRLKLNGVHLAQIIASPDQLCELGVGFVICEGLSQTVSDVHVEGNTIEVSAPVQTAIDYELRSSGCIGIRGVPRRVDSNLTIALGQVSLVIQHTVSEAWQRTGGAHCSVLVRGTEVLAVSSDIGRHSTVDKVVGFATLNGIDLGQCAIGCTGRQPAGMIAKVANAGVPVVISKAAATTSGIMLADTCNVTLICFARGDRFTVYSHPERIRGLTNPRPEIP
jgi:FdhD protein